MKIIFADDLPHTAAVDALAVAVTEGAVLEDATVRALDKRLGGAIARAVAADDFTGKGDQSLSLTPAKGIAARRLVVVGLGKGPITRTDARSFGVRAGRLSGIESLAIVAPSADPDVYQGLAEGLPLGAYRYDRYLTGDRRPKKQLGSVRLIGQKKAPASAEQRKAVERGLVAAEAVTWTRDWVNGPPNDVHPESMADEAKKLCEAHGIQCTVYDKAAIAKRKMDLLLAVNKGSSREPRLVHMKYAPKKPQGRIALVGKGITFDSGGLCIKTAKQMADMKCDMAGAALTIASVVAAARIGLPVEVHGIAALTENMTGPEAYRPGDVYTSLEGKTVEIINTDAEGRLILADALSYAQKLKPDVIVDHATLTGACMVALGPYTAGLYANDNDVGTAYYDALTRAGESAWRMPLLEELREGLKSDVADLKHTGEQYGGSVTAALFLREFVGDCSWIHMDIAGPAFLERAQGIAPKGATGYGVLGVLRFLEEWKKS